MEGHWWAGATARCPHVLKGLQWRAVLVDKLHTHLIPGLLSLAEVAQHSSPEHCGQGGAEANWMVQPGHPFMHPLSYGETGGQVGHGGPLGTVERVLGSGSGQDHEDLDVKLEQKVRSRSQIRARRGQVGVRSRSRG